MIDIVERLRALAREFHQHRPHYNEAADEIERLKVALQRIDGINDNPAIFNADIEAVLRSVLGGK